MDTLVFAYIFYPYFILFTFVSLLKLRNYIFKHRLELVASSKNCSSKSLISICLPLIYDNNSNYTYIYIYIYRNEQE